MKKRILAILAAVMLSALSVFYPYAEAKAAGLPELIYTALPLTWPLVTKIFQALGVGTAEYFNSLPLVDRESLITGFRGAGAEASAEIWSKFAWNAVNDNLDDYIPAVIDDGVLRVSQSIFDVASEFAKENGMLGGIQAPSGTTSNFNTYSTNTIITENSFPRIKPIDAFDALYKAPTDQSLTKMYNAMRETISNYNEDYTMSISYSGGYVWIGFTLASSLVGLKYTSWSTNRNIFLRYYGLRNNNNESVQQQGTQYTFTKDGLIGQSSNLSQTSEVTCITNFDGNKLEFTLYPYGSNVGKWTLEKGGSVPEGEKGQTAEQDGAWSLPYDDGSAKPIDNFGDTYPLSIPDYIGQDLLRWRETAQDIDLGLADLADDLDITRPVEGTQTKAQEGTVDEPYEIDVDSPLIPSVPALTVPNFIKERFPFCIPFDLVRMVKRFTSNDARAPVFDMERPFFGTTIHLHIDFSMFDDLARLVRIGVLALTAIGIMKVTVDVIKW